jgi:hypothetical protein
MTYDSTLVLENELKDNLLNRLETCDQYGVSQ